MVNYMKIYYKAKHILLEELEDIDYILNQLESGISFEDLAREYSECETAQKGGSLGRFPQGTMLAEFERALYHMKIGEVKSGVQTKFGYHIILREE
jgi:parvulin-like peptidyl-prolyl isomerase